MFPKDVALKDPSVEAGRKSLSVNGTSDSTRDRHPQNSFMLELLQTWEFSTEGDYYSEWVAAVQ